MIADAVTEMMDSVISWLFDKLMYLARVIAYWLPADFTSLSEDFLYSGQILGLGFKTLVFASYAIVIVVGGFLVMTNETLQTRYNIREILPRLVMGMLLAGLVWTILFRAFEINNDVVHALIAGDISDEGSTCRDPAWDVRNDEIDACDWQEGVEYSQFVFWVLFTPEADQDIELFHIVVAVISIVCLLVLLITSVIRNIALFFVAALAPIALACHGLPITETFAHLWWRMLGACMASSIGQAALIWMFYEIRDDLPDEDDDILGYWSLTRMIYLVLLVWLIWKVHKEAFRIARGRPLKVPGSRLLGAFVMSRVLNRNGRSKRKTSTPDKVWGTTMRPPWHREKPTGKDAPGTGSGPRRNRGGDPSRNTSDQSSPATPGSGVHDSGPNAAPANPHDRRSTAAGETPTNADTTGAAGADSARGKPSWKRPLPEVADGGFDADVAGASLHGASARSERTPGDPASSRPASVAPRGSGPSNGAGLNAAPAPPRPPNFDGPNADAATPVPEPLSSRSTKPNRNERPVRTCTCVGAEADSCTRNCPDAANPMRRGL